MVIIRFMGSLLEMEMLPAHLTKIKILKTRGCIIVCLLFLPLFSVSDDYE